MKEIVLIVIFLTFCGKSYALNCVMNGNVCEFKSITLKENEILARSCNSYLKEVKFVSSNLHSVPGEVFMYYENLEKLYLDGQNIKTIREKTFENATKLTYLSLDSNKIEVLKDNSFSGAKNLETLRIRENILSKLLIEENAFDGLSNLKILVLDSNKIEFLYENTFKTNSKLKEIHLEGNQLNALSHRMFSHLTSLNHLHLRNNTCIKKDWDTAISPIIADVEKELLLCSMNYKEMEKKDSLESSKAKIFNNTLAALESKLEKLEQKNSNFNETLFEINNKIEIIFEKIETAEQNDAKFEKKFKELDEKMDKLGHSLDKINENLQKNNKTVEILETLNQNLIQLTNFNSKFTKLEGKDQALEESIVEIQGKVDGTSKSVLNIEKDLSFIKAFQVANSQKVETDFKKIYKTMEDFTGEIQGVRDRDGQI